MIRAILLFIMINPFIFGQDSHQRAYVMRQTLNKKTINEYLDAIKKSWESKRFLVARQLTWFEFLHTGESFLSNGGRVHQLPRYQGPIPNCQKGHAFAVALAISEFQHRKISITDEAAQIFARRYLHNHNIQIFTIMAKLSVQQLQRFADDLEPHSDPEKDNYLVINGTQLYRDPWPKDPDQSRDLLSQLLSRPNTRVHYHQIDTIYDFGDIIRQYCYQNMHFRGIVITGDGDCQSIRLGADNIDETDYAKMSIQHNVYLSKLAPFLAQLLLPEALVVINGQATGLCSSNQLGLCELVKSALEHVVNRSKGSIHLYGPTERITYVSINSDVLPKIRFFSESNQNVTYHHVVTPDAGINPRINKEKLLKAFSKTMGNRLISQKMLVEPAATDEMINQMSLMLCRLGVYDDAAEYAFEQHGSLQYIKSCYFKDPDRFLNLVRVAYDTPIKPGYFFTVSELLHLSNDIQIMGYTLNSMLLKHGFIPDTLLGHSLAHQLVANSFDYVDDLSAAEKHYIVSHYVIKRRDLFFHKRLGALTASEFKKWITVQMDVSNGTIAAHKKRVLMLVTGHDETHAFNINHIRDFIVNGYDVIYHRVDTKHEAFSILREHASRGLKIDVLEVSGHGFPEGIILGGSHSFHQRHNFSSASYGTLGLECMAALFSIGSDMTSLLKQESVVILDSCSTAGQSTSGGINFAGMLSLALKANLKQGQIIGLYAATRPVHVRTLDFETGVSVKFYESKIPLSFLPLWCTDYTYTCQIK